MLILMLWGLLGTKGINNLALSVNIDQHASAQNVSTDKENYGIRCSYSVKQFYFHVLIRNNAPANNGQGQHKHQNFSLQLINKTTLAFTRNKNQPTKKKTRELLPTHIIIRSIFILTLPISWKYGYTPFNILYHIHQTPQLLEIVH